MEIFDISANLSLGHGASTARNDELDWIFDGENMFTPVLVDEIKHGGDGRGLSHAGCTCHEQKPSIETGDPFEDKGQTQLCKAWYFWRNDTEGNGQGVSLLENIQSKPAQISHLNRTIKLFPFSLLEVLRMRDEEFHNRQEIFRS